MATHNYTISTERLDLLPLERKDAAFVLRLLNTEGWLRFIGDRNVHSQADAENYIERILAGQDIYYWKAESRQNPQPVGVVTFLKRDYLDHFDIGFAFLPEFGKKGFAYESAKAVLDFARLHLQHQTVAATTLSTNLSSINLLEKLGFSFLKEMEKDGGQLMVYVNRE